MSSPLNETMIASLLNQLKAFICFFLLLNSISYSFAQDCTDIVSTRQVLNTDGDCGSWCGSPYVFTLGAGDCYTAGSDLTFTEYSNGTALLTGSVLQNGNVGQLSVTFTGRTDIAGEGSPKYMLCISDGGDFWYYYPSFSGVFTHPDGSTTNMIKHGPAFQIGYGANVQDTKYGASGWFNDGNGHAGDMNFQLSSPIECQEEGIFLDAECAEVGSLFNTIVDEDASNQTALTVESGNNAYSTPPSQSSDRVRFNTNTSKTGAYNIFARVKAPTSIDDSFWVRVNDGTWVKWNLIQSSTSFIWDQVHDVDNNNTPVSFFLEAGNNTIDFAYREDGTILDQIYISQDLNAPTGIGVDAENCSCFSAVNINCNVTNDLCQGSVGSQINLNISGTSSNFDILWSNGATTQSLNDVSAGTYSVTVTGDAGCTAICEATIEDIEPFSINCESTDASCNQNGSSNPDGTVTITANGGTGPYIYHWSNNACTSYESNLQSGTYTITVTDANGCQEICSVDVGSQLPFYVNCNVLNDYCGGNENASIYIDTPVNPANLTYLWSTGETTSTLNGAGPGTYSVTVTSIYSGCTKSCEATIEDIEPFSILCESTDVVCGNATSGTGSVTVTGGVGPYTYHWSNNACAAYEEGLTVGTYTITVSDSNGCEEICTIEIENSETTINATAITTNNTDCEGNDICDELCFESTTGNPDVNAQMSISYNVAGDEITIRTTYAKTFCDNTYGDNTIGWPANNHTFHHVHKSDKLELALYNGEGSESLKFAMDFLHDFDGTFRTGGIEDGDGEMIIGNPNSIIDVKTSISENFNTFGYVLTTSSPETDANYTVNPDYPNWIYEMWYEVTVDISAFGVSGFGYPEITNFHASPSKTGIEAEPITLIGCCGNGCNGTIDLTVTEGSGPFSFLWSNGEMTEDIDGLCDGQYSVTVIDANGCSNHFSFNVELGSSIELICEASEPSCDPSASNSITTSITGGSGDYTFAWSNGDSTQNIDDLNPGTYSLTVTDSNGCSQVCETEINSNDLLNISCTVNDNVCEGNQNSSITTLVDGGSGNYTFLWNNGSTSSSIENVGPGAYSVTVNDENGCFAICETNIAQLNPFTIECNSTDITCAELNNGTANVTINGGTAPFTFAWSNGNTMATQQNLEAGIYTVTATDANNCSQVCETEINSNDLLNISCTVNDNICDGNQNSSITTIVDGGSGNYTFLWSNSSTTSSIENIGPGTYSVTVTDENGCSAICETNIAQLDPFTIECNSTNTSCGDLNDGSIEVITNGGTAPFTFAWSNGNISAAQQNLEAGIYTVTVTDANNCSQVCNTTVNSNSSLVLTCTTQENPCNGNLNSSINTQVSGGSGNYTFLWSNGNTTSSLENVGPGSYSVTVNDENGCPAFCETTIEELAILSASCSNTNTTCSENNDGSINVTATGGTIPYSYFWSNGNTNQVQSNLAAGIYMVTVTDANGCETVCSSEVTSYEAITLSCSAQGTTCIPGSTSSITSTVSGGTGNYTFLWSNGTTSQNLNDIASGIYTVTVTDSNGCSAVCESNLENMEAITASCEATDLACGEANTGNIVLNITGGTAPLSFAWNNGATTQNLDNINAGNYQVTITDANGCTTTCATTVEAPAPIIVISSATPLLCFGDSTATADLHIEGGVAPFTYLWDNGSTEPVIENLGAGFYGVTVTDANGCTGICGPWVVNPDPINVSFENDIVTCFGGNDGSIISTVTGGTGAYTFEWSNGATTQDLTGLTTGEYTLTVSDENGCSNIFTTTIESNAEMIANCSSTPLSCHQNNSGSILLNVNGGFGNYTYLWNTGATTQHLENLSSGTYSVTTTDENGCSTTCSTSVEEPILLTVACNANQLECGIENTGSINISVAGGTPPFSYQWNNNATTQNISDLGSGTYEVTVIDANECSTSCSAVIEIAIPFFAECNAQDLFCGESNSGSIEVTTNGGTAPFTYAWSNGATTQNLSNLNEGIYEVTITDANGCDFVCSTTINLFDPVSATCTGQNLLCGLANSGNINLSVIGGTAPFSYLWSNGATSQNLNDVSEGTYSVTVTDINGCVALCEASLNIIDPIIPTCTSQNLECGEAQTGSISVSVTGGTAPFSYFWSNGVFVQNQTNLNAGVYTVTIADANGCTATCTSVVEATPILEVTCTSDGVTCGNSNSGNVYTDLTGGVGPYTYLWSTGDISQDLLNVPSGAYAVTITDSNGCITSCNTTVEVSLGLNLSCLAENTVCGEANTGSIDLSVNGGTGNYTFEWSNGATTEDITELDPGTYTVTVSDTNGCTGVCSSSVQQTTELEAVCDASEIPCGGQPDGSVDVTVTGGSGDYTYEWNNGATTEDITGVSAGTYSVTVSDSNGCTTTCSTTITEAAGLSLSCLNNNISCRNANDGSINTTVNGGTEPYTFEWSTGATSEGIDNLSPGSYSLTVTDVNGCSTTCSSFITQPATLLVIASGNDITCNGNNDGTGFATVLGGTQPYSYAWSNGSTTSFTNNLSAGSYTLTVTDGNGCQNFGTITINEPEVLTTSTFSINENCQEASGAIDLTVEGGTAPYTYNWSNEATTEDLFNIVAGTYFVTVTDSKGCSSISSAVVEYGDPIILTCIPTAASCGTPSVGNIDLTVSGGNAPYTYLWSNGMDTEDADLLPAGIYTVTVTDAVGCSTICISEVEAAPGLSLTLNTENVDCNGGSNGSISTTIQQGMPPFTYAWSNGETTEGIEGLSAGSYSLTVTDVNGCQGFSSATITSPSALLVVISSTPLDCDDDNDGTAFVTAIGGIAPYTYSWNTGASSPFINALSFGTYMVTVTDNNGCSVVNFTTIEEPAPIEVTFTTNLLTCQEDNTGSIETTINGGSAPYIYEWSNGATTANIDALLAGIYNLTVTDNNGCSSIGATTIEAENPLLVICTAEDVFCSGEENGQVAVEVLGGEGPYTYLWNDGDTTSSKTDVPVGQYSVTVTDTNGCSSLSTITVEQPEQLIANYGSIDISCNGANDGILEAVAQGGTMPYTFEWSTGDSTETVENLPAGAYGLTLSDANGCIFICGLIINEPTAISCGHEVSPANSGNPDLFDINMLTAGGTGDLSYSIDNGVNYQSSPLFQDVQAGIYTVLVVDANGCMAECGPINVIEGSGLVTEEPTTTDLSPNPASSELNVVYDTPEETFTIFEVKNMTGKVLYTKEMTPVMGTNTFSINTLNLVNGTYVLAIYTEKGVTSQQFIVLKGKN